MAELIVVVNKKPDLIVGLSKRGFSGEKNQHQTRLLAKVKFNFSEYMNFKNKPRYLAPRVLLKMDENFV